MHLPSLNHGINVKLMKTILRDRQLRIGGQPVAHIDCGHACLIKMSQVSYLALFVFRGGSGGLVQRHLGCHHMNPNHMNVPNHMLSENAPDDTYFESALRTYLTPAMLPSACR